MSPHNSFPSLHADANGTPIISAVQKSASPSFREYVASILDAVAQGKPVEVRRMFTENGWSPFDKHADREIGFNFRHYEYRIAKETRSVTFRLALVHYPTSDVFEVISVKPSLYEEFEPIGHFIQWLGEEQTITYEV